MQDVTVVPAVGVGWVSVLPEASSSAIVWLVRVGPLCMLSGPSA